MGHQVAAQVGLGGWAPFEIVIHHAEFLEHVAADIQALMAGNAAIFLEALVAVFFLEGEDVGVALQVLVETRVGRQQGAFVGRQGILHIGRRHAVGVHLGECGLVLGDGREVGDHGFPVAAHFRRADDHLFDLGLEGVHATVPELFEIQAGVEHRGRIELDRLAVKAQGKRLVVGPAGCQSVATGAGQAAIDRQAFLVKQLATQFHRCRIQPGYRRQRCERFIQRRGQRRLRGAKPEGDGKAESPERQTRGA